MQYVDGVPPAMIEKIKRAKETAGESKARAKANGTEYIGMKLLFDDDDDVVLYEKLATHPDMASAWRVLAPLFDDTKRCPDTWTFAMHCRDICRAWDTSPKRTPLEHREYFSQLADDMMSVATRVMIEPEFGALGRMAARVSPVQMVSDEDIAWFIETIDASPEGGYVKAGDGISYTRFCLHDIIPDLYRYAEWIANNAREIAQQASISERPHRDSAARTFFVRHLSNWLLKNYQARMHEVVATVAAVVFDEAVTGDNVRKLVTGQPEDLPLLRPRKLPLRD